MGQITTKNTNQYANKQTNKQRLVALILIGAAGAYVEHFRLIGGKEMLVVWGLLSAGLVYVLDSLRPAIGFTPTVLAGLGRVSFSMYLVHMPIIFGLGMFKGAWIVTGVPEINFLLFGVEVMALSYCLAYLLFFFVEKPGINLGKVIIRKLAN